MDKEKVRRLVEEYAKLVVSNMVVNKIILYGPRSSISDDILKDMAKLFKLRRSISNDIEPVLLIDEDDPSGFLESISQYGEVVYAR